MGVKSLGLGVLGLGFRIQGIGWHEVGVEVRKEQTVNTLPLRQNDGEVWLLQLGCTDIQMRTPAHATTPCAKMTSN